MKCDVVICSHCGFENLVPHNGSGVAAFWLAVLLVVLISSAATTLLMVLS